MSESTLNNQEPGLALRPQDLIEQVLNEARRQGADSAEATINTSSGLSVRVRMGELESIEHVRDKGLAITVFFGTKTGSANTTDFRDTAINDVVRVACGIARYTGEDDCAGLADPALMADEIPDLDLHHPWDIGPEQAGKIALEAESAARAVDSRIANSEGATVSRHDGRRAYGNSHGFLGEYTGSRHRVSCTMIAESGSGMQRDYWYSVCRNPTELEPPEDVGRKAAERALKRLDARQLSTRTVPVIFASHVATSLFGHFITAIRGGNLYRKASFLLDHLDKQIFPQHVCMSEQPHLRRGLGSAPFDGEGVATRARDLVTQGVLNGYVLDSYSARKLGMQTTGNAGGVRNLSVQPGAKDFNHLLREMDTGLLVSELMGMGVNTVSGDYSRGAAGFWVEHGEIQYPVGEITIAGNLRDMFMGMLEVGSDVDERTNIRTGSVLIDRMTVAGG